MQLELFNNDPNFFIQGSLKDKRLEKKGSN